MWKDEEGVRTDFLNLVHNNNRERRRFSGSNQVWKPEARQAADKMIDSGFLLRNHKFGTVFNQISPVS